MKKLLIATAALAMVAGTAQAQSSVTVYGIIDTGYNSLENNVSGTKTETNQVRTNGEASTSRFGFRGTEDLGGGLKANFVMESNIGNTNGNNDTTTRNVLGDRAFWAGLQDAKMGEVRIGLQNTFNRDVWLGYDQLAFANVAGNLTHNGNGSGAGTAAHTALSTAVNYMSPVFSGVQVMAGVMQNESQAGTDNKQKTGSGSQVGLKYTAGKFSAAVAYVEATTATNAVAYVAADTADNTTANTAGSEDVAASNVKTKDTSVGASYDLGVAKLGYNYSKRDAKNSVSSTTASNIDRESHAFSASIPLSAKLIGRVGYGFGEYQTGAATPYNGDIKGMQAALNYNLSKRTTAYVIYGDESRETSATAKTKSKEYSVGVRHSF
jgi:predicted porin